jgi:hypothetical protein
MSGKNKKARWGMKVWGYSVEKGRFSSEYVIEVSKFFKYDRGTMFRELRKHPIGTIIKAKRGEFLYGLGEFPEDIPLLPTKYKVGVVHKLNVHRQGTPLLLNKAELPYGLHTWRGVM